MQLTKSNAAKGAGAIVSHRRKPKGLKVCCATRQPALGGLRVYSKFSAPFGEEQSAAIVLNPPCIAANMPISDWSNPWNNAHSLIKGPSIIQSANGSVLRYPKSLGPFCNAKRFAIVLNILVRAPIALLFFACSPLAVLLAISKVVINSFNRTSIWRLPHIGKKVCEVSPFVTNGYSPSSVVIPLLEIRICAALNNSIPCGIGASSMRSMLGSTHGRYFPVKTSARFSFSAGKVLRCAYRFRSAITSASPTLSINSLNGDKPSKAIEGQILRSGIDIASVAAIDSFSHSERLSEKLFSALRACFCDEGHRISLRKMFYEF